MPNPDTYQQNTAEQPVEASYRIPSEERIGAPIHAANILGNTLRRGIRKLGHTILDVASLADPNRSEASSSTESGSDHDRI